MIYLWFSTTVLSISLFQKINDSPHQHLGTQLSDYLFENFINYSVE